jgi:sugar phosphate isomerase/epimerase
MPARTTEGGVRLLASTGPLMLSPMAWTLEAIADAGYDAAEVLVGQTAESRDPDAISAHAAQAGLEIPVVHGPYMLLLRNVLGTDYREKTRRSLELTAALGAEVMVAHAPFRWERKARRWLDEEVEHVAAEHGVVFAMENLFPVRGRAFSSVVTAEELVAYRANTFDTSHAAIAGLDLFEAWDLVADRCVHLHVSDNFGNGKDSHAPIGSGTLPLEAFLRHVGASGWTGTCTLELDCRSYLDTRDALVGFLARERVKAAMLLAEGADERATKVE